MKIARLYVWLATLGPLGYLSASGTVASFVTLPLVYWLQNKVQDEFLYIGIVLLVFVVSLFIVRKVLEILRCHEDPAEIVIDEVVGCLITFWGVPFSGPAIVTGFVLFRFFDIIKLGTIKECEDFVGAWGIMLDDVMAALISNLILRAIF